MYKLRPNSIGCIYGYKITLAALQLLGGPTMQYSAVYLVPYTTDLYSCKLMRDTMKTLPTTCYMTMILKTAMSPTRLCDEDFTNKELYDNEINILNDSTRQWNEELANIELFDDEMKNMLHNKKLKDNESKNFDEFWINKI